MLDEIIGFLKSKDVEYCEHVSLAELSSIKAGGSASVVASPDNIEKMVAILTFLMEQSIKFKVVGNMTNIMSLEGEYPGVVIRTDKINRKTWAENKCSAECGARLSKLLWEGAKVNLGGAEELFMIPAFVGGAVFNNAGAHNLSVSDIFINGVFYSLSNKKILVIDRDDMGFGYRKSVLRERDLILLSATFELVPMDFATIREKIRYFASARRIRQPLEYPSLGCVFKRYGGIGAGYYIDKAGLKGYKIGGAEVSDKHAGFIINKHSASPSDIIALIELIKTSVYNKFGIMLEEEIEII